MHPSFRSYPRPRSYPSRHESDHEQIGGGGRGAGGEKRKWRHERYDDEELSRHRYGGVDTDDKRDLSSAATDAAEEKEKPPVEPPFVVGAEGQGCVPNGPCGGHMVVKHELAIKMMGLVVIIASIVLMSVAFIEGTTYRVISFCLGLVFLAFGIATMAIKLKCEPFQCPGEDAINSQP